MLWDGMRQWSNKCIWLTITVIEQKTVAVKTFIREELRNEFKATCAIEGRNMSDVLAEFIESYVRERQKQTEPRSSTKRKGGKWPKLKASSVLTQPWRVTPPSSKMTTAKLMEAIALPVQTNSSRKATRLLTSVDKLRPLRFDLVQLLTESDWLPRWLLCWLVVEKMQGSLFWRWWLLLWWW